MCIVLSDVTILELDEGFVVRVDSFNRNYLVKAQYQEYRGGISLTHSDVTN